MTEIYKFISGALLPSLLLGAGAFMFFYLRLWRRRGEGGGGRGGFSALCMALGGTLGVGNIVGVSAAIASGGYGAVFWMCVSAIAACSLKYSETVLACVTARDGVGGAPLYIRAVLGRLPRLAAAISAVFALLCLGDALGMGCILQVNAVAGALSGSFGLPRWVSGGALALLIFICASGGAKRLVSVNLRLVPIMTLGFTLMTLAVLVIRAREVPSALSLIIKDAFDFSHGGRGILGGIVGFLSSRAVRFGVLRGLISNEAGSGTSPMAHASSSASPHAQGLLGIAEVLIDTVVLCTMTALVVIINIDEATIYATDPVMMTVSAYAATLGRWASYALAVAVGMFGFATVVTWSFYGLTSLSFLTEKRCFTRLFTVIFSFSALIGAFLCGGSVWTLADFCATFMTLINVVVLLLGRRMVRGGANGLRP